MSQPKQKKISSWVECERCLTNITNKDVERHTLDCPPSSNSLYGSIKNKILTGYLDIKLNEEIKGVTDRNSLVFLSQSAIQLCELAIGEWAIIKFKNSTSPIAKIVWPTTEKALTSVLLTKQAFQLCQSDVNEFVTVQSAPSTTKTAHRISIKLLNQPKYFEITSELINRIHKHYSEKLIFLENVFSIMYFGKIIKFQIKSIEANLDIENLSINEDGSVYRVTHNTVWDIYNDINKDEINNTELKDLRKLGGLENEILELREALKLCFTFSEDNYGLTYPRSILLYGHSGTGKTALANAVAKESLAYLVEISASDLYSRSSDKVEDLIKSLFEEACDHAPSVIIIEELDILCPFRSARITESEKRIVSTLIKMLDNLTKPQVFVLGITNKLDAVDSSIRRCGRFDRELEIPTPSPKDRNAILTKLLYNVEHDLSIEQLNELAFNTHGYVGADLLSLCSRSGMLANRSKNAKISLEHFKMAQKSVRPSAMREVQVEVSNVRWADIGGQKQLKMILKQAIEWPLKHPECFLRLGVTPPKGILMFGPPGCSKTMVAKALATESGLNFLSIKGPELFSKWVGESEKAVREVFKKARQVAPSIIFFDEIDALGGERASGSGTANVQDRVLAQLLTELDGVSPLGDVTVLAATNRPDRIDKALLRPGRLDRIVYVSLPDEDTRRDIFRIKFSKMPIKDVNIDDLVKLTSKYSGAEVNALCHEAAMMALEENLEIEFVEKRHFDQALEMIIPRTPDSLLDLYKNYLQNNKLIL